MEGHMGETFPVGVKIKAKIKSTEEKSMVMKYIRVAVLLCFVIGIIGANIMDKEHLNEFQVLNTYFIEKFKYIHINSLDLFWHIFEIRIPILLLLLLFAITDWGTLVGTLFLMWQGFAAGFLMAVAIISYGGKGILLMGTAAFPHYFIYVLIYVYYIYLVDFLRKRMRLEQGRFRKNIKKIALCFGIYFIILSIYIVGILGESYISPYLLQKILYIF